MRALGLMSGTSLDGIDVALIDTDGETVSRFGPSGLRAYADDERALLRRALAEAVHLDDRNARPPALAAAEAMLTKAHAEAVQQFCRDHGVPLQTIDMIGFHGQTVIHRPERRLTVQIGDGARLAQMLGRPVVYDMRAADVAAGGQGAPLVPVYHRALARSAGLAAPVALLNIGGVANITFIGSRDVLIACDTGPGNALLDDLVLERTGKPFDAGGALAAHGMVRADTVQNWLSHRFFAQMPPKSLDRNAFSRDAVASLEVEDAAATLTAFTAQAVAAILPHLPERPTRIIACGGGTHNPTLLAMIAAACHCPVEPAERYGWSADAMEAQAFAFLAVRAMQGLPLTFPGTTGVPSALTGGVIAQP